MDQSETFTRLQLAQTQLDRAIRLHLEEADHVCAITLAGAADELLGRLVARHGAGEPLVENYAAVVSNFNVALGGSPIERKEAIRELNAARDSLKHLGEGEPVSFNFADEAYELIDRAAGNFLRLTGNETPEMVRFRLARGHNRSDCLSAHS